MIMFVVKANRSCLVLLEIWEHGFQTVDTLDMGAYKWENGFQTINIVGMVRDKTETFRFISSLCTNGTVIELVKSSTGATTWVLLVAICSITRRAEYCTLCSNIRGAR